MCEKGARIAELESEIEWRANRNPVNPAYRTRNAWLLTVAYSELARLRNEPPPGFGQADKDHPLIRALNGLAPSLTQEEGSEPVGWRRRWKDYSTGKWGKWDYSLVESPPYEGPHKRDDVEAEPLYASPPPLPDGNTDPRVREALEFGFASYQDGSFELIAKTAEGNEVTLKGKLEEQQLEEIDKIFPTCVFVKYGINPLPSPQSQGLVEAAEIFEQAANLAAMKAADLEIHGTQQFGINALSNLARELLDEADALRSRASDRSA